MVAASASPSPETTPTFSLTAKQQEANRLLGSPARNVMLRGGSRSGKTFLLVRAVIQRGINAPGSRHAIFRFRFNHAKTSVWSDTMPKVLKLCFPGLRARFDKTDFYLELPNGSQIWIGGLDDKERVEKILGQEYATLYFNESSQIPWGSVETAMSRLAQRCELDPAIAKATGRAFLSLKAYFDCNPPSKLHWSYQLFRTKVKPGTKEALPNPADYVEMKVNPADNAENLPSEYFDVLASMSAARRLRFEAGEWASEVNGALWSLEDRKAPDGKVMPGIDSQRVAQAPEMRRVVVSVDPSGTRGDGGGDDIGIIVAGRGVDGRAYVLADGTVNLSPEGWGRRAVDLYHRFNADRIVGERNFGGDMVRFTVATADRTAAFKEVVASRGKAVRAEPIAALYEQCVSGDALISCERGQVPIRDVRAGDRVWTRAGLKPVLWSGQTGVKPTFEISAAGKDLRLTSNHPVLTTDGWVCAGHLARKERSVFIWKSDAKFALAPLVAVRAGHCADPAPQSDDGRITRGHSSARSWFSRAYVTSAKRTGIGVHLVTAAMNCFTAPFGNRTTSATSPMDGTSTIGMRTRLTTLRTIWRRSLPLTIRAITIPMACLPQVEKPFALSAHPNFSLVGGGNGFAQMPAAVGAMPETNANVEPVYNLHVEGQHEYVANGILVHNCKVSHVGDLPDLEDQLCNFTSSGFVGEGSPDRADALVWALTELMLDDETYDPDMWASLLS